MICKLNETLKQQKLGMDNLQKIITENNQSIQENLKILEARIEKFC